MRITILGGGLAAVSLAYFLQEREDIEEISIIEKEGRLGGLCRSFVINGVTYDIGPHIIFSKNKEILQLMLNILGDNKHQLRRSNQIIHKRRFVQYPFENDLAKLPRDDIDYCVNGFLHNPYEEYIATNMLQFFLKTFGEGITNLYLRPYNEKIWKFDPSFMDTQMVERIPKPPREDILKSAKGETIDGYLHQLYFWYPRTYGIESLIHAFTDRFSRKVKVYTNQEVQSVSVSNASFCVTTAQQNFTADKIISTIPVNLLCTKFISTTQAVRTGAMQLRYNSIIIAILNVNFDRAGNNFSFMVADKNVIFHRFAKIDFLGSEYHLNGTITYMVEVTYRQGDLIDQASDGVVLEQIVTGLVNLGFIDSAADINFSTMQRFPYAYVVYDLMHRYHMEKIRHYFAKEQITLHGRFGDFEYLNMDSVIERSRLLAQKF